MQILKAGVLYFTAVFGAGFVLGPIRILWAVPRFSERMAELMEAPIIPVVTIVAARWTGRSGSAGPCGEPRFDNRRAWRSRGVNLRAKIPLGWMLWPEIRLTSKRISSKRKTRAESFVLKGLTQTLPWGAEWESDRPGNWLQRSWRPENRRSTGFQSDRQ